MEVKINQVVLHLLDPGASEPVLSDRAMDMDADLCLLYTSSGHAAVPLPVQGQGARVPGLQLCVSGRLQIGRASCRERV